MIEALQLGISLLTLGFLAWGAVHGIRVYRRQMNAQLFLAFTQRYREVCAGFIDQNGQVLDISEEPPPSCDQIRAVTIQLLNLISEEYYLYTRGYLDKEIWSIWEAEMIDTLRSSLIRREWPVIRRSYHAFADFQAFVDNQQATRLSANS